MQRLVLGQRVVRRVGGLELLLRALDGRRSTRTGSSPSTSTPGRRTRSPAGAGRSRGGRGRPSCRAAPPGACRRVAAWPRFLLCVRHSRETVDPAHRPRNRDRPDVLHLRPGWATIARKEDGMPRDNAKLAVGARRDEGGGAAPREALGPRRLAAVLGLARRLQRPAGGRRGARGRRALGSRRAHADGRDLRPRGRGPVPALPPHPRRRLLRLERAQRPQVAACASPRAGSR